MMVVAKGVGPTAVVVLEVVETVVVAKVAVVVVVVVVVGVVTIAAAAYCCMVGYNQIRITFYPFSIIYITSNLKFLNYWTATFRNSMFRDLLTYKPTFVTCYTLRKCPFSVFSSLLIFLSFHSLLHC
jgi:hypothetical protein